MQKTALCDGETTAFTTVMLGIVIAHNYGKCLQKCDREQPLLDRQGETR